MLQKEKQQFITFLRLGWRLALTDFKLRNEGSYLGNLWYLLNPLLMFVVLYFIFADRLGAEILNYPAYLLIGILLFNFFTRTTIDATQIIRSSGFIKSFKLNLHALVLSVVIKHLLAHLFEAVLFFVVLIILGLPLYSILYYFAVLFLLSIFVYGCSLLLSVLTMYFVDLGNIWQFFTTLVWFGTPIFYSLGGQDRLVFVNQFNPMYYFITVAREFTIYGTVPDVSFIIGIFVSSIITLMVGMYVFYSLKNKLAEMV